MKSLYQETSAASWFQAMPARSMIILVAIVLPGLSRAQISTDQLLDTLQRSAFNFFWNEVNPANGLIRDRSSSGAPSSIASVGFGLTAICIGADHGWVQRDRDRKSTRLNSTHIPLSS